MVMKVGIAALKARLSEHLRAVRKGRTITVLDRDTPVARIVPLTARDSTRDATPARGADSGSSIGEDGQSGHPARRPATP